jgi:hypothetical protein
VAAEVTDSFRWQARIAHAAAAGSVPWQHASLATGLIGLVVTIGRGDALPEIRFALAILQSGLLLGALWLSLRLRIDAVLFGALAEGGDSDSFDGAMVDLGWLNAGSAGRPMSDRFAGLIRLVRLLVLTVAAQLGALVATGWFAWR